jgi:surface antigen
VATRRSVTWLGNAFEWYGNAGAQGLPEGQTPRPGAIMVTWESGWGHVAYVEQVFPDGSWKVSEMNFVGFAVVSSRTIKPGGVPLIGFIY